VDPDDDGPRAELAAFLRELRETPEQLKAMFDRELGDVRKKGPWLLEDLEGEERLRDLLEQVGPLLLGRLDGGSAAVSSTTA
jgi:hypothetical protein